MDKKESNWLRPHVEACVCPQPYSTADLAPNAVRSLPKSSVPFEKFVQLGRVGDSGER